MRDFLSDLRLALRLLRRNPAFAVTAILLLALGIGANTAIFSVVNAVLLRPLPYQDPSRLMQIWHVPPAKSFPGMTTFSVSPANFLDWQRQNTSFEDIAAYGGSLLNLGGTDRPESLFGSTVTPGFFSILRVQPALGRTFSPEEDRPDQGHVAVLSDPVWRNHFGANPSIVGQDIVLNGEPYRVVGVMPPGFKLPGWANIWVPTSWTDDKRAVRGNHNYSVIGRLKPGVDTRAAQSELSAISTRLEQLYPEDDKGWGATIIPLRQQLVGNVRPALLVLLGAVAFVLLIACANVANLLLVRASGRSKEIAIRSALGASRADILRQVLAETLLLSVTGGALGFLLANLGITLMSKFLADRLPRFAQINLDVSVLAFTVVISLCAGVLAGLLPALRFTKADVNEALKQGQTRGSSDSGGRYTRSALVVCEVALSLVLLIGAGLMVRTLWELSAIRPGFDPNGVLTMSLSVANNKFPTPAGQIAFFERVLQQVRATPGVESAGAIDDLPISDSGSHQPVQVEGQPVVPMSDQPEVDVRSVSGGYFGAMHIPLVRGRDLDASDVAGRVHTVIVSQAFAERFWPGQNPLGKHVTLTFYPGVAREVVGVVGDIKLDSLDETRPVAMVYWPIDQIFAPPSDPWRSFGMSLAVRTTGDPMNYVSAVTTAVHQVDPETPVIDVFSMSQLISNSLSPQRSNMLLLAAFAGLALVLTAVGIYSVLAYTVRRRVREIGIRMALGASQSDVLQLVVRDGMKPILLGVTIGLAAALALGRVVAALVYGVRPTDPLTFATVALLLLAVGLLATVLPAYRATQIDPTRTLREE